MVNGTCSVSLSFWGLLPIAKYPQLQQHLQPIQTVVQELIAGHEKVHRLQSKDAEKVCDPRILQTNANDVFFIA